MSTTMTFTGELTIVTCWCGTRHAIPAEMRRFQLSEHSQGRSHYVHCPHGHTHAPAGESEVDRLKKQLAQKENTIAWERSRHDQTKAELRDTTNKLTAQKAAKTRLKNRIAHGVCPCCNRSFANLERHMKGQHPEFVTSDK